MSPRLAVVAAAVVALGATLTAMTLAAGSSSTERASAGPSAGPASTDAITVASTPDVAPDPPAPNLVSVTPSPSEDVPSGLEAARSGVLPVELPEPAIPLEEIRSGGVPPDGIPSIDDPRFLDPADVDFLADQEPVMSVDIDGDVRAYPVQILIWHEIVNDTFHPTSGEGDSGPVPVAVTYCPLCNSAVAFDRRVGDRVLTFGTSGMLWNSALVMYDRQTETMWSHFTGAGLVGVLTDVELETFPVALVSWATWRDAHPDGLVLSTETGHARNYGVNPYPGYDDIENDPFLFAGEVDGRYTAMTRVVGVELDGEALAVPLFLLAEQPVITVEVGGIDLVVWWEPGTVSPLDAGSIADGADVGTTGVFRAPRDLEGLDIEQVDFDGLDLDAVEGGLTFDALGDGDGFVDEETGSRWNVLGAAVDGPLAGARMTRVDHIDTFWFAWAAFHTDSTVVGGAGVVNGEDEATTDSTDVD